jgi:hypothetical protein
MKIKSLRRLVKSDFLDAPKWFDDFLVSFNDFLDVAIGSLRQRLTFAENFYCEEKDFEFTHNVELLVTHKLESARGVIIMRPPAKSPATTYGITSYHWRVVDNKTIGITLGFAGAGTTKGNVRFLILG